MYRPAPEVLGFSVAAGGTVLAVTGFAFGLYLAIAAALIVVGLFVRRAAMARR